MFIISCTVCLKNRQAALCSRIFILRVTESITINGYPIKIVNVL